MGYILDELVADCRLIDDGEALYVVSENWKPLTQGFDDVRDATPARVLVERQGNEYELVYDSGRWVQRCLANGGDDLYCNHVRCERHEAYDSDTVRGDLPTITADEYGEWTPPLLARIRLALRHVLGRGYHS